MAESTDKQIDMAATADQRAIAWEAPEFYHYDRDTRWVVSVWVAGLILAGLALWVYKVTFFGVITGLVPLVAALALTSQSRLRPTIIRLTVDQEGITVNGQSYAWKELKSFWLVFSPVSQAVYVETTRRFMPILTLQLGKTDPELVRSALLAHLPERTDRAEEFGDRLGRMIRF